MLPMRVCHSSVPLAASKATRLPLPSSRRSTVLRPPPRATEVTTGYQRASSSKRPMASVLLVARGWHDPKKPPPPPTPKNAPPATWKTTDRFIHSAYRPLTTGHSIPALIVDRHHNQQHDHADQHEQRDL